MRRHIPHATGLEGYRSPARPHSDFDPLTASAGSLLRQGLPRRPDPEQEPGLSRIWQRAFARPLAYVRADFAIDPWLSGRHPLRGKGTEFGLNNWAGAVMRAGQPFSWVFAEWTVPVVPKKGVWDDTVTIGFWVGIDGRTEGDNQVLQAGVAVTMHTEWVWHWWGPWREVMVDWRAWTEWFVDGIESSSSVTVPNFPVQPGDTVGFIVCAPRPDSPAWVNVLNSSTGYHTAIAVPTPVLDSGVPVTLQGDSVEWIVEFVEPATPYIPPFDPVTFRDCWAGRHWSSVGDLGSAFQMNVMGPGGDVTEVQIVQPHTTTVRRIGG